MDEEWTRGRRGEPERRGVLQKEDEGCTGGDESVENWVRVRWTRQKTSEGQGPGVDKLGVWKEQVATRANGDEGIDKRGKTRGQTSADEG